MLTLAHQTNSQLHSNSNRLTTGELIRKLIHLSGVFVPVSFFYIPYGTIKILLGAGFLLFLTVDVLRLKVGWVRRIFMSIFGRYMRDYENNGITGATTLAGSAFFVALVFPKEIAALVLFYTILSDGVASIVGQALGRRRIRDKKTLEGSLSFLAVSIIIAILYRGIPFWWRVSSALVATSIELLITKIDDNITIPVGTAIFLQILKILT